MKYPSARGILLVALLLLAGCQPPEKVLEAGPFSVPTLDISRWTDHQVVVDREPGQYLGHPTTVLLEDGHTILATYPKGHGRGEIVYKRSLDAGKAWSDRLAVPESWETSQEVPTLYRIIAPDTGRDRLLLFSGLYPIRSAYSDDEGAHWSELEPIGDFGGIVAMASLLARSDGSLVAYFHDDGRFLRAEGERGPFVVYETRSADGGLHWGPPTPVVSADSLDLCEPGLVRSPDGAQLALLLRENRRVAPSQIIFSGDEGDSWSEPRALPLELTGDRHTAAYLNDGRLLVVFRDMAPDSPTRGDWVGWIGSYDDLFARRSAGYRVRFMDNKNSWDSTYPGVLVLDDGTIVTTTYGHWVEGEEPFIVTVRVHPEELDGALSGSL